jgi:hypothetical protein
MELFKKFGTPPVASKFSPSLLLLLLLLLSLVDNMEEFQTHSDIYNISTRYRYNLHVPATNLGKHQKGGYCKGMKLFNNLPPTIKRLNHINLFRPALKKNLLSHSYQHTVFSIINTCSNGVALS